MFEMNPIKSISCIIYVLLSNRDRVEIGTIFLPTYGSNRYLINVFRYHSFMVWRCGVTGGMRIIVMKGFLVV